MKTMLETAKSIKGGAAAGPHGTRTEHYTCLYKDEKGMEKTQSLIDAREAMRLFTELSVNGMIPKRLRFIFFEWGCISSYEE